MKLSVLAQLVEGAELYVERATEEARGPGNNSIFVELNRARVFIKRARAMIELKEGVKNGN